MSAKIGGWLNGCMDGRMDCARMGAVVGGWADGWTFAAQGDREDNDPNELIISSAHLQYVLSV